MSFKLRYLTEETGTGSAPKVSGPSNAEKFIAPVKSNDVKLADSSNPGLTKNTVEPSSSYISNSYTADADTKQTFDDASKTQNQIDRDTTIKKGTFSKQEPSSNFENRYKDILPS